MRIVSRARSLIMGLIAMVCVIVLSVYADTSTSVDFVSSKADSYYRTITQNINAKSRLSSTRKRLWTSVEKSYIRHINSLDDGDKKLIAQVVLTQIQQRNEKEIIPTQDLVLIRQVINATNAERKDVGLPALGFDYKLTMAAYRHARDMRDHFPYDTDGDGIKEQISHKGSDGLTCQQRVEALGYDRVSLAENIAYNQTTVEEVMTDRMESPHHQENILSDTVAEMGVAKVGPYWVQVFGKERVNK